jgi:hypothetical protein
MTELEIRARLTGVQCAALTAWAEARGDRREGGSSLEERVAVLSVIRTRARAYGGGDAAVKRVCLAPSQFSCWNAGTDHNHLALMAIAEGVVEGEALEPLLRETLYVAQGVLDGVILDPTLGCDCYYAPRAMAPHADPAAREAAERAWAAVAEARRAADQAFARAVEASRKPPWARDTEPAARIGEQLFYRV